MNQPQMPSVEHLKGLLLPLLDQMPSSGTTETAQILGLGQRFLERERYQAAIELYDEVVIDDSTSEAAFVGLSLAHFACENFRASMRLLNQAITLHKMLGDGNQTACYERALSLITQLNNRPKAKEPEIAETGEKSESPQERSTNASLREQVFSLTPDTGINIPLILDDPKICIFFSSKCGCTTVVKWVYHHLGLLEAANIYSSWPHDFRAQVLNKSPAFLDLVEKFPARDYSYYLVTRNPYRRLLSAYCHFGLRQKLLRQAGFSGDTVSFKEFATVICRDMDLSRNSHVRPQYMKQFAVLEREIELTRIKIEDDLIKGLTEIERRHNLPNGMPESLKSTIGRSHHHGNYTADEPKSGSAANDRIDFDYNGAFAPPKSYFDGTLLDLIYECYETDFIECNYRHGEL